MSEQVSPQRRVTVAEASVVLGISHEAIRKLIQAGTLDSEFVPRPGAVHYLIALPEDLSTIRQRVSVRA